GRAPAGGCKRQDRTDDSERTQRRPARHVLTSMVGLETWAAYQLRKSFAQCHCVTICVMPRPSPVRDRVRDLVLSGSLHDWTIEELLARVRKDVATADYSTVFRAVSYLEEKD